MLAELRPFKVLYCSSLLKLSVPHGCAMDVFGRAGAGMARAMYLAGLYIPAKRHQHMHVRLE